MVSSCRKKFWQKLHYRFSANFSKTDIDKLPTGNDAALAGVLGAPVSYNLKDNPYYLPSDPYTGIYYREGSWDNPYGLLNIRSLMKKPTVFLVMDMSNMHKISR
jgi:hypothetical protein